jgi:thiamine-monophosphate kinase
LATCDPVIEGVHFEAGTPANWIGRKAMNRCLSDLAAMAGRPRFALVSAMFPATTGSSRRRAVYRGLAKAAAAFGVRVVGGDLATTPGPLTLAVTVLGEPWPGVAPVRRDGARPGHLLFVSGALGGSRAGKHLRFVPRVAWAQRLAARHRPSAMIDISDGLLLDLHRVLMASGGHGAELEAAALPISAAARRMADRSRRSALDHALSDGEDYELLFTLPRRRRADLATDRLLPAQMRRPVGRIIANRGLWLVTGDRRIELTPTGHQHLR